jgi:hypothetical protein
MKRHSPKKNVAIVISGMYREFDRAFKSWKFLEDIEPDFYFSTWDRSYLITKDGKLVGFETIDEAKIRRVCPTAKCIIEPESLPEVAEFVN